MWPSRHIYERVRQNFSFLTFSFLPLVLIVEFMGVTTRKIRIARKISHGFGENTVYVDMYIFVLGKGGGGCARER